MGQYSRKFRKDHYDLIASWIGRCIGRQTQHSDLDVVTKSLIVDIIRSVADGLKQDCNRFDQHIFFEKIAEESCGGVGLSDLE